MQTIANTPRFEIDADSTSERTRVQFKVTPAGVERLSKTLREEGVSEDVISRAHQMTQLCTYRYIYGGPAGTRTTSSSNATKLETELPDAVARVKKIMSDMFEAERPDADKEALTELSQAAESLFRDACNKPYVWQRILLGEAMFKAKKRDKPDGDDDATPHRSGTRTRYTAPTPVAHTPPSPAAPEPPELEPAAPEPPELEPAAPEPAKLEPAKLEPAKLEPAKLEPPAPEPPAPEPPAPEPAAPEPSPAPAPEPQHTPDIVIRLIEIISRFADDIRQMASTLKKA